MKLRGERRGPRRAPAAFRSLSFWVVLLLALALAAGMAWTLWAGRAGKIRSLHGAVGDGRVERSAGGDQSS